MMYSGKMSLRTREDIWHEAVADPKFRRIMIEAEEKLRRNPRVVDLHCSGRETLEVTGILINLVETDGEIRHYGTYKPCVVVISHL